MSVTSDFSSTANDNDARERAQRALRDFAAPPRSPYEALEPVRPPEFPEREPWRMHPVLAFFNALFVLTLFTACVLLALFYFFKIQFDRPGPLPASTVVVIPKGEGAWHRRQLNVTRSLDRGMFRRALSICICGAGAEPANASSRRPRACAALDAPGRRQVDPQRFPREG
jgi:hypothetical protein